VSVSAVNVAAVAVANFVSVEKYLSTRARETHRDTAHSNLRVFFIYFMLHWRPVTQLEAQFTNNIF
jgi:hypothetical protein